MFFSYFCALSNEPSFFSLSLESTRSREYLGCWPEMLYCLLFETVHREVEEQFLVHIIPLTDEVWKKGGLVEFRLASGELAGLPCLIRNPASCGPNVVGLLSGTP